MEACRASLIEFTKANAAFYQCTSNKLKTIFDQSTQNAVTSYNCIAQNYKASKNDLYEYCHLVTIPDFHKKFEVSGLDHDFGIPPCVVTKSNPSSVTNENTLLDCKQAVDVFTGGQEKYSFSVKSAQKQYNEYTKNLYLEVQRNIDKAIDRFNCLAEHRGWCL